MTLPAESYRYRARLERVVDGDTVYLTVDLGFRATMSLAIRLAGIDAPERYKDGGPEATAWLRAMLVDRDLLLESAKGDKYGRWLGTIYHVNEPVSINSSMIEAGHATSYGGGLRS